MLVSAAVMFYNIHELNEFEMGDLKKNVILELFCCLNSGKQLGQPFIYKSYNDF